jgi:hypothetical protein
MEFQPNIAIGYILPQYQGFNYNIRDGTCYNETNFFKNRVSSYETVDLFY